MSLIRTKKRFPMPPWLQRWRDEQQRYRVFRAIGKSPYMAKVLARLYMQGKVTAYGSPVPDAATDSECNGYTS